MALEPEVAKSCPEERKAKTRRAQVRYKIRNLPHEVRRELDRRLLSGEYPTLGALSLWLEQEHGRFISVSSIASYRRNYLDPTLQAVKLATAQAAEIVRVTNGGEEELNFALFRVVQTAIFDLLVQLNRTRHLIAMIPAARHRSHAILANRAGDQTASEQTAEEESVTPQDAPIPQSLNKVELAAITALGRTVAMVSRALIEAKRWRQQTREKLEAKVAATREKVAIAARDGGLSAEAEALIRKALTEIKL